jgi:hypothetical protein
MKETVRSQMCKIALLVLTASTLSVSADGAEAPLDIDACSLLRADEIAEVLSLPVEEGVRRDAGLDAAEGMYSSTCVWTIADGATADQGRPLGGRSFVILNAMQWQRGSGRSRAFLDAFRKAAAAGEIPAEPSPRAFGDEALWWGDGLAVRRADVSFGISAFVRAAKPERPGAVEERLAPLILRRLDERARSLASNIPAVDQ